MCFSMGGEIKSDTKKAYPKQVYLLGEMQKKWFQIVLGGWGGGGQGRDRRSADQLLCLFIYYQFEAIVHHIEVFKGR